MVCRGVENLAILRSGSCFATIVGELLADSRAAA